MQVGIIAAKSEDANTVSEVFISARRYMTYLPEVHTDEETKVYISNLVKQGKIYVLRENETIAGLMMVEHDLLSHLYIDPKFSNKGYGKMLLDKAKELCSIGLSLWVFEQNIGAIKFYEREGFQLLEKRDKEHADNEENLPDRKYVWKK